MTKTLSFTPIVLCQKKMKRISSNSSLATLNDSQHLKYQKNRKIAESVKVEFIELVTQKNFSMKNAAKLVGISYSTAKKIFTCFRQTLKTSSTKMVSEQTDNSNLKRAHYFQIQSSFKKNIQIMCLIAGISQQEQEEYHQC